MEEDERMARDLAAYESSYSDESDSDEDSYEDQYLPGLI